MTAAIIVLAIVAPYPLAGFVFGAILALGYYAAAVVALVRT